MSRRNRIGSFWPSALQERLLVVALDDPDAAVAAWEELQPRFELDRLERGSYELMPLIYRNLARGGYEEPALSRLKGIYRKTWVANNLLAERTGAVAETLREAGVSALFVEGVILAARFYPELGLRPTSAVDVLVDERDGPAALAHLARTGWHERADSAGRLFPTRYLVDESKSLCLLRTKAAADFVSRRDGRGHDRQRSRTLWENAEPRAVGAVEVLAPTPTATLLAVCVFHARAEGGPNVQWIADAKVLLEAEIDWEWLLAAGAESGQSLRLREVVRYLTSLPGATPPDFVAVRLDSATPAPRERLSYLATAGSLRGTGALPLLAAEHLAATADDSALRTVATFPRHLRERWNLARSWQVPLAAGRRALRLLARRDGAR